MIRLDRCDRARQGNRVGRHANYSHAAKLETLHPVHGPDSDPARSALGVHQRIRIDTRPSELQDQRICGTVRSGSDTDLTRLQSRVQPGPNLLYEAPLFISATPE